MYHLVRPFASLALKVQFRKIYFSGVDRIPKDKPVILAVNHPTAFLEPCVVACFQPQALHFLVRGDLFKKRFFRMLLESLKNLGITVGISLAVAFLYFLISPIHDENSNLLSRTAPTFLDVVVAIFGGLAGVIAHTQGKNDTVIPGVAIATALMPPLCTAGYGLAIGNWGYFFGASYLFLLNSLLIAASAYFFIRYLKFPKKEYLTPKIDKRVRVYTWVFIIIAVAPSGYLFYKMTKRSIFEGNANAFVTEVVANVDENIVVNPTYEFDWDESVIHLAITNFYADEGTRAMWDRLKSEYDLDYARIHIQQDKDFESLVQEKLEDYDQKNAGANTLAQLLSKKENELLRMQQQIDQFEELLKPNESEFKIDHVLAGFKIDYPEYKHIYINESYSLNASNQLDTNYIMSVEFNPEIGAEERHKLNSKISRRMKLELSQKGHVKQDTVRVISLN